jgi:hypothetical protein
VTHRLLLAGLSCAGVEAQAAPEAPQAAAGAVAAAARFPKPWGDGAPTRRSRSTRAQRVNIAGRRSGPPQVDAREELTRKYTTATGRAGGTPSEQPRARNAVGRRHVGWMGEGRSWLRGSRRRCLPAGHQVTLEKPAGSVGAIFDGRPPNAGPGVVCWGIADSASFQHVRFSPSSTLRISRFIARPPGPPPATDPPALRGASSCD